MTLPEDEVFLRLKRLPVDAVLEEWNQMCIKEARLHSMDEFNDFILARGWTNQEKFFEELVR